MRPLDASRWPGRAATTALAALFVLLAASPVRAVSNRIFMSTNGNNANDCANPLTPCLTFAGALAQVNPGGEVIAEATGGYGPLNITQPVTISGPPGVVIYSGLTVTVNAPGAIVILRGLTIDGTGASANGIDVLAVASLFVESCVISGFDGLSTTQGNGISFATPGLLFVKDTTIRNNGFIGIVISSAAGPAKASIEHCRLEGNRLGLDSQAGTSVTIRDSVVSGNASAALASETNGDLNIENCVVANNSVGILSSFSIVRVSNSTVTDNGNGLNITSGSLLSRGNNTVEGNTSNGSFSGTFASK